ncbi:ricin-type beta-trefoil lectin domain-containing protein [Colletotrichum truncatum]|uniref:Ricin-type beta-trefoil lectin domain-containing protein n=1 Tax=Colletotrichum truncatum TaxID=5467 RepID=A0ACC3YHE6_COLTU
MIPNLTLLLAYAAAFSSASPIQRRAVTELNEEATKEAQQRDGTATRAFSNIQIRTADGRCLFVDKLSGDFRANLTPIQVAQCGTKDGEGWDVVTAGKHNDQAGSALIVSSLTQACFNFDPRRQAGNQVLLFSCGGRADGGGGVTTSQLFEFNGGGGSIEFKPKNEQGKCFTVKGDVVDVADCNTADQNQTFAFGDPAGNGGAGGENGAQKPELTTAAPAATDIPNVPGGCGGEDVTITMTVTATADRGQGNGELPLATLQPVVSSPVANVPATSSAPAAGNGGGNGGGNGNGNGNLPAANPTTPVPVSRAGGTLNPTAAAEAHAFDDTATREFTKVAIRAANGQCLSVNPTAGDFRQNLIPVALAECNGTPNQQWDIVTKGKHNDGKDGAALVVSSLMNGCVSTDGRRADGDTVTMFSCGGRAAGEGLTNTGQLVKIQGNNFVWTPVNDKATCVVPGNEGRLVTAACRGDNSESYTIIS